MVVVDSCGVVKCTISRCCRLLGCM